MNTKNVGQIGEDLAAEYLKQNGYKVLERNYRCRVGELDIVAGEKIGNNDADGQDKIVVFVEVKTLDADNPSDLNPEINFTPRKLQKISRVIEYYLLDKTGEISCNYRIDLIAVELNFQTRKATLRHYKNLGW